MAEPWPATTLIAVISNVGPSFRHANQDKGEVVSLKVRVQSKRLVKTSNFESTSLMSSLAILGLASSLIEHTSPSLILFGLIDHPLTISDSE